MNLDQLLKERVFACFHEISRIPRCSHHEEGIAVHLQKFAEKHGLPCTRDTENNLIIKRPMPGRKWIALQSHIDMVCIRDQNSSHDFSKDPLKLVLKEDMLYAGGTSLGADNGIGAALMMDLLSDPDYQGPGLECIFTANEEDGMTGATALDLSGLESEQLINLDAEEEGRIHVSCAGGVISRLTLDLEWKTKQGPSYELAVLGLIGGHSGLEIHQGRGNANILLGRILSLLREESISFRISELEGGSKVNAIADQGSVKLLLLKPEQDDLFLEAIRRIERLIQLEFRDQDPDIRLTLRKLGTDSRRVFTKSTTTALIGILNLIPNGVLSMNRELEGLVETSSNLGVVSREQDHLIFSSLLRSSSEESLEALRQRFILLKAAFNLDLAFEHPYPAWPYNKDSLLNKMAHQVYQETFGEAATDLAIHAGLECGILLQKKPMLDIISIGPNTYLIHTPREHVSIPSVLKLRVFVEKLLQALG